MSDSDNKKISPEIENRITDLSRREFMAVAGGTVAAAGLITTIGCSPSDTEIEPFVPASTTRLGPVKDFQDRYRNKWSWDGFTRGTHNTNCGFSDSCSFNIYTRNGKVLREEQAAIYQQTNENVPDFNPRGCQKGCTYSEMIYNPARVEKPLKRKGERGSGEWEEVSWDEALTDIADSMIDAMTEHGPETVIIEPGSDQIGATTAASMVRFADVTDCVVLDINTANGDDLQGAAVTFGDAGGCRSGDDFFNSDLIVLWCGNPAYTQIPDYHFLTEARYNGAQFVAIGPDLNASAIHADLFIPIKPGTDPAFAMSVAKVLIDENRYDAELIREQTDLPFLVRLDNKKLLRESDIKKGGSAEVLYRYDIKSNKIEAPGVKTLELNGSMPALEGTYEVDTVDGKIKVQPTFEVLKTLLQEYTPEKASEICGVSPGMIRKFAYMMADAKAASNVVTFGPCRFYHGDLMQRTQILVFVLSGHLGKPGAGYLSCGPIFADGFVSMLHDSEAIREARWKLARKYGPKVAKDFLTGKNMHRTLQGIMADTTPDLRMSVNSTLFWNIHADAMEVSGQDWGRNLKRPISEYVEEAISKNWQILEPAREKDPKVLFSWAGNLMRRVRSTEKIREVLWPKLDMVVALELRLSSTAMMADYVLPVASSYEKPNVMVNGIYTAVPYILATNKAIEPVGIAKDEWEISCLLVKKIEQRAKERGIETFTSRMGHERRFDKMYKTMTRKHEFGDKDAEKICEEIWDKTTHFGKQSWRQLKKKGYARATGVGNFPINYGQGSDIKPRETITPYTWHTEKKEPWSTLSGRIQFYIDHDWYLEFGEQLPVHIPPPMAGGDYPLVMTGGHNRWSIHSLQRTDPLLLRLQRGEPCMWISVEDASNRGISDGDKIEVHNDVGRFITRAKVAAAVRPGQVIMYHAWENYQFEGGIGYRNVMASPLKPVELVGDYPYMNATPLIRQPGMSDRDTRVDIKKLV